MRVLAGKDEVSPKSIAWSSLRSPNFTIRQDSGTWNALGAVKIDMPNSHAVYMHDTNNKNAFDAQYRFLSHGCTRVRTCVSSRRGSCPTCLAGRTLTSTPPSPRKTDWRSSCRDECQWLGSTSPAGRRMMAKCSSGMTSMILITVRPHLSEANCDLLTSPVHIWMHDERGGLITATSRATRARPGGC